MQFSQTQLPLNNTVSLNSFLLKCITLANSNIKVYTINGLAYTTQLQYSSVLTSKYADYEFLWLPGYSLSHKSEISDCHEGGILLAHAKIKHKANSPFHFASL